MYVKEALEEKNIIIFSMFDKKTKSFIGNIDLTPEDIDGMFAQEQTKKSEDKYSSMTIEDLDLTVRSTNGLRRANITKVSELKDLTYSDLKNINSIGEKSIKEIIDELAKIGIIIKGEDE